MSQIREKIETLKDAITQLYCVEGKSLNYISGLFKLTRSTMTEIIKHEWKLEQRYVRQTTPKVQKQINKHKPMLIRMLSECVMTKSEICKELGIDRYLLRTMIDNDRELQAANEVFASRESEAEKYRRRIAKKIEEIEKEASVALEGEIWKPVLGYDGYSVSNMGRVMSHKNGYTQILKLGYNKRINMVEIALYKDGKPKMMKLHRLVALAFIPNPDNKATVNHKDGDRLNNTVDNLEWSTQTEQNVHKNDVLGRPIAKAYGRNGKFKVVVIDDKYTFKTLKAAAKFLGVSETQINRYVRGETKFDRKIELKY